MLQYFCLRKPKVSVSQILRRYPTKESRVRKFFCCLIWIKESCVRKYEGLARSKILGISQTNFTGRHTKTTCIADLGT